MYSLYGFHGSRAFFSNEKQKQQAHQKQEKENF